MVTFDCASGCIVGGGSEGVFVIARWGIGDVDFFCGVVGRDWGAGGETAIVVYSWG